MLPRNTKSASDRKYKIHVHIKCINETITLDGVTDELLVSALKKDLERRSGIPTNCFVLYYVDLCNLDETQTISYYHVLPGATIKAVVLKWYDQLVSSACQGNVKELKEILRLSCEQEKFSDEDIKRMTMCLFTACQRGYVSVVAMILKTGISSRQKMESGNDALRIAVESENVKCVELLLRRKIRLYEWNHERSSLFNWELQDRIFNAMVSMRNAIKASKQKKFTRLTYSQMIDSSLPTWLTGPLQRKYLCTLLHEDQSATKASVF